MKFLLIISLLLFVSGARAGDSDEEEISLKADLSEEEEEERGIEGVFDDELNPINVNSFIRSDGYADPGVSVNKQDPVPIAGDDAGTQEYSEKLTFDNFENIFPNLPLQSIFDALFQTVSNIGSNIGSSIVSNNPTSRTDCVCGGRDRVETSDSTAMIREFPWAAQIVRESDDSLLCAGSIISAFHIMTSAYCVTAYRTSPASIVVRLGTNNRRLFSGSQYLVSEVQIHAAYRNVRNNNIAIINLERPIEFSNNVGPVCIPPADQEFDNKFGIATTWGSSAPIGSPNTMLYKESIEMKNVIYCRWTYAYRILELPGTLMCARQTAKDNCLGYNGGVLVLDDESSTTYQLGIASFGVGCGPNTNFGMMYTNVISFRNWIMDRIPDEYKCFAPGALANNDGSTPARRRRPN